MTRRLLLALAALVPAVAFAAEPVSVDGKWQVSANIAGTASEMACTFAQKDADVTGKCEGDQGPYDITGKVDGKTVTWQLKTQYEGQTLTVIYTGTVESPDKFNGTVDVQPLSVSGDFTATRAK